MAARGAGAATDRMRRIGVFMPLAADDAEGQARDTAFCKVCSNWAGPSAETSRIDYRWGAGNSDPIRRDAADWLALAPDVILAAGAATVAAVAAGDPHRANRLREVIDPVGAGLVDSLARPGGNVTGFASFEYGIAQNGWSCSRRLRRA